MNPPSKVMPYVFLDLSEDVPFVHAVERFLKWHLRAEWLKPWRKMEISRGVKGNGVECAPFFRPHKTTTKKTQTLCHKPKKSYFYPLTPGYEIANCDKAAEAVVQIIIVEQDDEVLFFKKPFRAMQALGSDRTRGMYSSKD